MKFKAVVEYDYPGIHKPPVKAEIVLHGDRVVTDNIKWLEQSKMTREREESIKKLQELREHCIDSSLTKSIDTAIAALEQSEDMSAKEYREKMIAVFHETGHDELIAVVPYPNEADFDNLKNLLKLHPWTKACETENLRKTEMKIELKPCPFCGGAAILKQSPHIPKGTDYTPTCMAPSCPGRLTKKWTDREKAISAWNTRAEGEYGK